MAVPTWVPLFVLLGGLFSVYSCMYPTVAQSQLSVICVELGYPEDCNFKEATRKSSEWSAYVNFITGVLMCGVIGLWTASSDRVGRRWTLLLPSIGIFAMLVSWMLVLWFDSIYEHWRITTFAGTVVNTLTGSYAMALLSIFGQCGDLTTLDPQSRGWLFMLLEGAIGGSAIVGSQLASLSSVMPMKWVFTMSAGLCLALIVYALFCYPETIDPTVRAKPIDWRRAHVFGALTFCCFNRSARRALDADAMVLYRKRVDLYYGVSLDPDMQLPMDSAELEGSAVLLAAQRAALQQRDEAAAEAAAFRPPRGEGLSAGLLDGELADSAADAPAAANYVEACAPRFVPRRNALPVLGLALGLIFMVVVGYKNVQFNFVKQQFDVSGTDFANMLTYSAVARALGTLFLVPLVKPLLRMPLHELRAMQVAFVVQGLLMGCYYFATRFWHAVLLDCLNSVVSCISYGYMRALMTNQTSTLLQGRVLGLIAVVEVLTAVAGGAGVSWLFAVTADAFPSACYQLFGIAFLASAAAPAFIRDPAYDFNHRNIGHFVSLPPPTAKGVDGAAERSLGDDEDPDSLLVAMGGPLDMAPVAESGSVFSVAAQHVGSYGGGYMHEVGSIN